MKIALRALVASVLLVAGAGAAFADPDPDPASTAAVPTPPHVAMAAGILVDAASGKVLWSRDADVPRPPASLTKVLTALVVLDRANLDDNVTVTPEARGVAGARIYAEAGWVMPVRDLLWGLLLESGNDAAVALAQKFSPDGTVWGFAKLMNERARQLGAVHSSFVNPHGLDAAGHVATARDLAIITTAAMRNPTFAEMVSTVRHGIAWGDGATRALTNHNKLLGRYPGTIGIKTGFTSGAGPSLISAVRRGDNTLIAVVLDAPGQTHYEESISLYDWGFTNLPTLLAHPESVLPPIPAALPDSVKSFPQGNGKTTRVGGLDVVQLEVHSPISPHRRPATAVVGLCVAAILGMALVLRNPRPILRTAGPERSAAQHLVRLGAQLRRSPPL